MKRKLVPWILAIALVGLFSGQLVRSRTVVEIINDRRAGAKPFRRKATSDSTGIDEQGSS